MVHPPSPPLRDDEQGVAALPDDASQQQRARAEAIARPAAADEPCRCSGKCEHGSPCGTDDCPGVWIHIDRQPASLVEVTQWADDYHCPECRQAPSDVTVSLPELPWGQIYTNSVGWRDIDTFPDVRHPNFPDTFPEPQPAGPNPTDPA